MPYLRVTHDKTVLQTLVPRGRTLKIKHWSKHVCEDLRQVVDISEGFLPLVSCRIVKIRVLLSLFFLGLKFSQIAKRKIQRPAVVVHTSNLSTPEIEAEAGGSL